MLCLLAFVFGRLLSAEYAELQLNPNSSLLVDIEKIAHNSTSRHIVVRLKEERRCKRPIFVIRLSGTALFLTWVEKRTKTSVFHTYPLIVDRGKYYIEVLALYCDGFDPEGFEGKCMEPVENGRNVVTLPYATYLHPSDGARRRPRWVQPNPALAAPLPTRYQMLIGKSPRGASCKPNFHKTHCDSDPADITQHLSYAWADAPTFTGPLTVLLKRSTSSAAADTSVVAGGTATGASTDKVINICFVGDSHARDLVLYARLLKEPLSRVEIIRINSYFPQMFNTSIIDEYHCSIAVVSYGQWPLSVNLGKPWTKSRYSAEMRKMMETVKRYQGNCKFFIRSENYNGLGSYYTHCPAWDHRSIPAIDMINHASQQLARELQLDFIDLTHINGPLWDSSWDFCHPQGHVYAAELSWILTRAFSVLVRRNEAVTLYDGEMVRAQNKRIPNDHEAMLEMKDKAKTFL
jgi:hypothetical protein